MSTTNSITEKQFILEVKTSEWVKLSYLEDPILKYLLDDLDTKLKRLFKVSTYSLQSKSENLTITIDTTTRVVENSLDSPLKNL